MQLTDPHAEVGIVGQGRVAACPWVTVHGGKTPAAPVVRIAAHSSPNSAAPVNGASPANRSHIYMSAYSVGMTLAFPSRAVRDIRVRYVRQRGCPADFADVTVDFEPAASGFTMAAPEDPDGYLAALAEGMREELHGYDVAVSVVVRALRTHEVDSRAWSFRTAGRLAVREALKTLPAPA